MKKILALLLLCLLPVAALHAQLLGDSALPKAFFENRFTWAWKDGGNKKEYIQFYQNGSGKQTSGTKTEPNWEFQWRIAEGHTIEITAADNPKMKCRLRFNSDWTGYEAKDFNKSRDILGVQVPLMEPEATPAPAQPVASGTAPAAPTNGAYGGTNQGGVGAPAITVPPTTPVVSPEVQKTASSFISTYHNSLVFVTGKDGAGSGFIAKIGDANFLITNAHVEADCADATFKALDGTAVQPGTPSIAVGRDIFCMAQPAGGNPLEIMENVDAIAAVGDDVVVLGNAEGGGVINTILGKIVGIGPNLVEVDAPFVPGNSGSPIVHIKSGKVVGVATYTVTYNYDETTKEKVDKPIIRRFGYRLDNIKTWQPVNWQSFRAQAAEMDKIETLTEDLGAFFRDIVENNGGVTPEKHTNPAIKNRIDEWLAAKSHRLSVADQIQVNANFLSFLKIACQSDVTAARRTMSYDYFQRELADEQKTRDAMTKAFQEIIKEISK